MKSFTFQIPGTICFDIEAKTEKAARAKLRGTLNMIRGGLDAAEFLSATTAGYVKGDEKVRPLLADTYDMGN
jgi:hypothetical protein